MIKIENVTKNFTTVNQQKKKEKFSAVNNISFEINDKKIRQIATEHRDDGICAKHGTKLLIYRPAFEQFLLQTSDI